jgi:uncharacterized membrane protein
MTWQGIVAVYPDAGGAARALAELRRAGRRRWASRTMAVRRAEGGALRVDAPAGVRTGAGAVAGGALGTATGLLAGPVGWLALAGALAGGTAAFLHGRRGPGTPVRSVGDRLTPGASALVALVDPARAAEVERLLVQGGANLVTDMLGPAVAQLEARGTLRRPAR